MLKAQWYLPVSPYISLHLGLLPPRAEGAVAPADARQAARERVTRGALLAHRDVGLAVGLGLGLGLGLGSGLESGLGLGLGSGLGSGSGFGLARLAHGHVGELLVRIEARGAAQLRMPRLGEI